MSRTWITAFSIAPSAMPTLRPLPDSFESTSSPPPEPTINQVDAAALTAITNIYREIMPEGGAILDVMSSWVCHLPPEIAYRRVAGIGVDACVLAENPFLDEWRVQDLNRNATLPYGNCEFDGAAVCGAIQHLTRPAELIRDIGRVLRPGAPLVVTFSQRCLA